MSSSFKPPVSLYNDIPAPAAKEPVESISSTKRLLTSYDSSSDSEDDSRSSASSTKRKTGNDSATCLKIR